MPQPGSVLVASLPQARLAAAELGYPLVLKPRGLYASIGVVKVDTAEQLAGRFRVARGARTGGVSEVPGADVLRAWRQGRKILLGPEDVVDGIQEHFRMPGRTMQELRGMGLVEFRDGQVTIHDLPRLQAIAEFDPAYLYLERRPR